MKKSWRQTFQFGLMVTVVATLIFYQWNPIARAMMVGSTAGILFGGLFYTFYAGRDRKQGLGLLQIAGREERVRMREGVSHFHKGDDIGGMLYLTEDHLVFMSHTMSWRKHQLEIPLEFIQGAEVMELFGHAKRGLKIVLKSGQTHRFSTPNPQKWVDRLDAEIEEIQ